MTDEQRKLIENIKKKAMAKKSAKSLSLVIDDGPTQELIKKVDDLTQSVKQANQDQLEVSSAHYQVSKRAMLTSQDPVPEVKRVKESIMTATSVLGSKLDAVKDAVNKEKPENTQQLVNEIRKTTQALEKIKLPTEAKDALPVRLSDGEEFYKAVFEVVTSGVQAVGGGGSVPKITLSGGVQAVPVVNPDGTNISGGGGSSGTQYADGASRSTATGTLMMVDDGTNIQSALGTTAGVLKVDISATTANSTAVKVDGSAVTQPVSGSVTATQATGTNLHTVVDSGTVTIGSALPAGSNAIGKLAANDGVDIGDVTINNASGGSAVNVQDGGNSLTVDYATTGSGTATGALRVELPTNGTGVVGLNAGSAIVGKVGIDQTTPGTTNLVALSAETTKVIGTTRTLGNAGATLDATVGAGTAPTNMLAVGGIYNSTEISPTTGQSHALQTDAKGRLRGVIMDAAGNTRGANVNSSNQLSVSVDNTVTVGSHAVTNAGTFVVQENGAALTSLQLIDDVVFVDDTATHSTGSTKGVGIMAVATPTDAAVDANDIGMVAMTTSRLLKVDASGVAVPVTDNSGSLTVDYATTGSGTSTGALRVELPTNGTGVVGLNAGTALIGKVGLDQTTPGTTNAVSIAQLGANTIATGNGASSTGVLRVAQVNDGTGVLAGVTTVTTLTNQSQEGGVNISLNAGTVDTGTRRVVQANGAGKTILSAGGSVASSGNNTLIAAGTNKLKVFAFTLSTTSTTAVTCIFQSGAGGTELWRVILQAGTSTSTGANLTVTPPAWLFATGAATLLNLNLSSAQTVHWSCSYFDEA